MLVWAVVVNSGNEDGDEPDGLVTWDEFLAAMKQLNSDKGDSGDVRLPSFCAHIAHAVAQH